MERASDLDWAAKPVSPIPCCPRENTKGEDANKRSRSTETQAIVIKPLSEQEESKLDNCSPEDEDTIHFECRTQ